MLPEIKPSLNGKYNGKVEAPPQASGASAMSGPTIFPAAQLKLSLSPLFYNLSHYWFGGAPLLRWPIGLLLLGAGLGALRWRYGGGWIAGGCLGCLVVLLIRLHALRRQDFVTFETLPLPKVGARALETKQKIPLFATGLFTVQGKYQRYTWLPGFYRTFATRERALLCQVQDQRFLGISRWPETERGLWYAFFMPEQVQQVRWGRLYFGRNTQLALAITYHLSASELKRRSAMQEQTLYLAVPSEAEGHALLADLAYDVPSHAFVSPTTIPSESNRQ